MNSFPFAYNFGLVDGEAAPPAAPPPPGARMGRAATCTRCGVGLLLSRPRAGPACPACALDAAAYAVPGGVQGWPDAWLPGRDDRRFPLGAVLVTRPALMLLYDLDRLHPGLPRRFLGLHASGDDWGAFGRFVPDLALEEARVAGPTASPAERNTLAILTGTGEVRSAFPTQDIGPRFLNLWTALPAPPGPLFGHARPARTLISLGSEADDVPSECGWIDPAPLERPAPAPEPEREPPVVVVAPEPPAAGRHVVRRADGRFTRRGGDAV